MQFPTEKFIEFAKQYKVPEYVKTASTRVFADIDDPRSKAACYFSRFAALTGEPTLSARQQYKRAEILNIGEDIEVLERNYADFIQKSLVKTAAPTEKYPLRNRDECLAAAEWLDKNAYAIPLPERRELATNWIKKANEYGITYGGRVEKYAGLGLGDIKNIIPNLYKRAELVRTSKVNTAALRDKTAQSLEALAEIALLQPKSTIETENLDKLAATLQFIDNEYGLHAHYGHTRTRTVHISVLGRQYLRAYYLLCR